MDMHIFGNFLTNNGLRSLRCWATGLQLILIESSFTVIPVLCYITIQKKMCRRHRMSKELGFHFSIYISPSLSSRTTITTALYIH